MTENPQSCPCGSKQNYPEHCGVLHRDGAGLGVTAESLMRARYCAYVQHNRDFLLATWHSDTRPESLEFDHDVEWLGLEIIETSGGGAFDANGTVEFRARFRRGGDHLELHELSSFVRVDGNWVYVSGE